MKNIYANFVDGIGNTPLIKLINASKETGCNIYGKAEFMNPGGSIKDRAALSIIEDAEKKGKISPGGIIVEGTAGNTGIGLALIGNAKGYKVLDSDFKLGRAEDFNIKKFNWFNIGWVM